MPVSLKGAWLMRFTTGRKRVLALITKPAARIVGSHCSAPAQAPTAAEPQNVAAVLRPRTLAPSFMMVPAPKKPTPETT